MLNWIWLGFLLLAVLVGGVTGRLPEMTKGAFETAESAVMKIALPLVGLMAIWLGIMRLAERSGLVQGLSRGLRPLLKRLFPEVPEDHPALGAMVMNMAANLLGLGNAATPLGLRAMAHLERLNPHPGTATNAMCTFLAINTASIQLVPTTAIALMAVAGSKNPTAIVPTAFLATVCAACSGVLAAKFLERLPWFRPPASSRHAEAVRGANSAPELEANTEVELEGGQPRAVSGVGRAILLGFCLCFLGFFLGMTFPGIRLFGENGLTPELAGKGPVIRALGAVSVLAVPFLLSFFPLYAAFRGVKVYEQFVEGAREAWGVAQRVVPYLVAMLVAVRMLREAGVIDLMTRKLGPALAVLHFPVDLLPMVLMRPLSGSATQGIFVELIGRLGPDSLVSQMAGTIYGSTETTFYVLAVYFGAVSARKTRHAVLAGLTADTVAVVVSVGLCRWVLA
jgi:spore maturation protein SpmA